MATIGLVSALAISTLAINRKLTEKDFVLLCNRGFYKGVSDRYMKAVFYGLVGSVEDRLMHLKSTARNNGCKDDLCAILYKHGGK